MERLKDRCGIKKRRQIVMTGIHSIHGSTSRAPTSPWRTLGPSMERHLDEYVKHLYPYSFCSGDSYMIFVEALMHSCKDEGHGSCEPQRRSGSEASASPTSSPITTSSPKGESEGRIEAA
jgi:hypothetical protein